MKIKTLILTIGLFAASCNGSKNDNEAAIRSLNEQSLKCISIMNDADAKKTAAINAGDTNTATAMQQTIDSAATANARIGQQLMELQAKK